LNIDESNIDELGNEESSIGAFVVVGVFVVFGELVAFGVLLLSILIVGVGVDDIYNTDIYYKYKIITIIHFSYKTNNTQQD
jgi:hypothetical protein